MKRLWEIPARYNILTASGSAVLLGGGTLAAIRRTEMRFGMRLSNWVVMLVLLLGLLSNTNAQTITSFTDDFETNDFSKFPWEHFGDASWDTTHHESHSGSYSAESGSIEDGESTTLRVILDCVSGYIAFYRKVSSESGFDYLKFYIDGEEQDNWSGEEDWAEESFPVTEGTRTFEWTYSKDSSVAEGDDTAWIDDIVFPVNSSLPSAVSTFHCIGVYWSPEDGSSDNVCQVHYRSLGSTGWKEALQLWYDDRGGGGYPEGYRGSIVNLEPGTVYEIKLELLNTDTVEEFIADTWSEDFPIARTVYLEAGTTNQPIRITESGSPEGYILYTHPEGESSTIDVSNQEDSCIYVSASYIIIRGLTLREARVHGIHILNNVHDVVIEECDISGWGRHEEGEWGRENDSAVFSNSPNVERIIVQRNKLHHPRYDTNSWKEPARIVPRNTHHPLGPQAITFNPRNERAGYYVIRYNEIYSDDDHYFKDSMGNSRNYGYDGFPIRDTDIYGNYVANCWDDGIQAEGANCNVRIWGNYITRTAEKIATQSVSVGPLYIWRNVFGISRVGPNDNYGWRAFKSGDEGGWGGGKTYIFHNTTLQPPPPDYGSSDGLSAHDAMLTNTCTRNNIFHVPSGGDSIHSGSSSSTNDFDYDLYNGWLKVGAGHELNGVYGVPTYSRSSGYDSTTNKGIFGLSSSSLGYDAGVVIPNFNDNYTGAAPDIGAHEAGSPPMEFGIEAYQ